MNIAFIPVRGGSKSIPLKNIKIINKQPLVYWTAKSANEALCIDRVVIATDSEAIEAVVEAFNFPKLSVYKRNSQNAQDNSSTESVMLEYLEYANLDENDNLFLIQATSPLLKSTDIDGAYSKLIKSDASSIFTGVVEKQFKWLINSDKSLRPVNYDYKNRPRRQNFEGLVAENGACYINSVGNIKRDKCRLSEKITFYPMPAYTLYELDEEEDWIIVETLMKHFE